MSRLWKKRWLLGTAVALPGLLRLAGAGLPESFSVDLFAAVAVVVAGVAVSALAVYMAASAIDV